MTDRTEILIRVVETYASVWHSGEIPSDRATFIARLLHEWLPKTETLPTEIWLAERQIVAEDLAAAVDCVVRARAARWQN